MTLGYQIKQTITKDIPSLDYAEKFQQEIREKENAIMILSDEPALRYCREHYTNGLGTRKFDKLCEMNFGYDDRFTVVAYSVDSKGKVLRTWANKYDSPEGDLVSETVFFPPKLGKKSIRYYSKDGKTYLENIKESLSKGFELS
tara:strand:- start:70 stop:501 length:432 start_codon:yes stop_codon:yes gene_type:complete